MHQDIFIEEGLKSLLDSTNYNHKQLDEINQIINSIQRHVYRLCGGFDEDVGECLYWNNGCGWTLEENATLFSFDEMKAFNITPKYNDADSFYELVGIR